MAPIPVICNRCKKMWFTHNFIGGTGNARITMIDNTVGPCPYCGGTGRIPDGVYELTGGVVRYLASGAVSVADLRRLQDVLRDAQQRNATPSEIAEDIERKVPAAGGIAATFSSTMSMAIAAWLTVLLSLITMILMLRPHDSAGGLTETQVEQAVEQAIRQAGASAHATAPAAHSFPRSAAQLRHLLATAWRAGGGREQDVGSRKISITHDLYNHAIPSKQ